MRRGVGSVILAFVLRLWAVAELFGGVSLSCPSPASHFQRVAAHLERAGHCGSFI